MTSEATGQRRWPWPLAVLTLAAFTISTGYGILLPRLSALLGALSAARIDTAWEARHLAGLTAIFFAAALISAPASGRTSDRVGRRGVLAAAGVMFTLGLLGIPIARSVSALYGSIALVGLANGGLEPVALAYIADRWREPDQRARRFAWLSGAVRAGYLTGPMIGELGARIDVNLPFIGPAAISGVASIAALIACRSARRHPDDGASAANPSVPMAYLLALSSVAGGGMVALEVAFVSPQGLQEGGHAAALLLTLCGAVMLAAQVAVFVGRSAADRGIRLIRPLIAVLAAALMAAPLARAPWLLAGIIAISGAASAALTALAAFLVARGSPDAPGRGLGLQYAAISGGQMLAASLSASVAGAGLYALWVSAAAAAGLAVAPARLSAAGRR